MALVKHNNNSISAVTSMASLSTGSITLIKEVTATHQVMHKNLDLIYLLMVEVIIMLQKLQHILTHIIMKMMQMLD